MVEILCGILGGANFGPNVPHWDCPNYGEKNLVIEPLKLKIN